MRYNLSRRKRETPRQIWGRVARTYRIYPKHGPVMVDVHPPLDPWPSPDPGPVLSTDTFERLLFHFEDCGWRTETGDTYEWWNVLHDGKIVGFLWYERDRDTPCHP